LFFSLNFLSRYTPWILRRILIVDMPWIFRAAYKTIQRFLPEDQREFLQLVTREQLLQEVIDPANAPDFMNGTCTIPYCGWTRSHPSSSSWIDFGFNNFSGYTLKRAHRFAKIYMPLFHADEFRSEYYGLLVEMLERALVLYGSKVTCQDVIEMYPRVKQLDSFERLEYMCKVLDAAGITPEELQETTSKREEPHDPATSEQDKSDTKSEVTKAQKREEIDEKQGQKKIDGSTDGELIREETLQTTDSIAVA
jgi:hypothetical protein